MKKHNGIRPQDIVILLKIEAYRQRGRLSDEESVRPATEHFLTKKEIAKQLAISASEVTESLARSSYAGLYDSFTKQVVRRSLMDFLQYGIKYVFPQQPGPLVRGIPTAHSAKPLSDVIQSNEPYVWPYANGVVRGQAIEPLYPTVVKVFESDPLLYEMLILVDAIRIGKAREVQIAVNELHKRLLENP